ncbi:MAG TPA: hypothetical protein VJ124_25725 [Pyrinomonadaceae bacterium]|nr:hypothetical protein [Pyrinomonadaceae bacterium]
MKTKTNNPDNEQRRIVAYLDSFPLSWDLRQERLASLRQRWSSTASAFLACSETQSAAGEELSPPFHFGDCRFAACAIRAAAGVT